MNMRKFATAAAIAMATFLASVGGAFAYDAAATTTLNVRSGPGTNFRVVGALSRNQIVQVLECNTANTWCRIQDRTLQGWASARYLQPVAGGTTPPRPGPAPVPTPGQPGFSINTPGFSISIGTPGATPPPPPPGPRGEVCFFEEFDYRGRSFCVGEGNSTRFIERFWDNRIRSARVEGNVEATVCTDSNFAGRCAVIDRSVRNLGMLSDDISSYWVSRNR